MKHGVTRFYFRYLNKYICSTFPHEHSLKIFVNILTIYIYIYKYIYIYMHIYYVSCYPQ